MFGLEGSWKRPDSKSIGDEFDGPGMNDSALAESIKSKVVLLLLDET